MACVDVQCIPSNAVSTGQQFELFSCGLLQTHVFVVNGGTLLYV